MGRPSFPQSHYEDLSLPSLSPRGNNLRRPQNELTCTLCTDIIGDLANYITDDTTEQQIVDFAKELCHLLGSVLGSAIEADCNAMFENNLPDIIDQIVNDNLDPAQVCNSVGLCP